MAKEQLRGLAKTVQLRIPFTRLLWIALAVCGSLTNGLFVHLKMIFFIRADLNAFYHAIGIAGHKGNGFIALPVIGSQYDATASCGMVLIALRNGCHVRTVPLSADTR